MRAWGSAFLLPLARAENIRGWGRPPAATSRGGRTRQLLRKAPPPLALAVRPVTSSSRVRLREVTAEWLAPANLWSHCTQRRRPTEATHEQRPNLQIGISKLIVDFVMTQLSTFGLTGEESRRRQQDGRDGVRLSPSIAPSSEVVTPSLSMLGWACFISSCIFPAGAISSSYFQASRGWRFPVGWG